MESPKLNNIKKELQHLPKEVLISYCLNLAKYKVENKEFLNYLLFHSENNENYIETLKITINEGFVALPYSDYTSTKMLRKQLRIMNKHLKFIGNKAQEAEISLYFCDLFVDKGIAKTSHKPLIALLYRQLKRVEKLIPKLEEDLQFDVSQELEKIISKLKKERPWFHISELK